MTEKNTFDILREEIEIPDIVLKKSEEAFSRIHKETEAYKNGTQAANIRAKNAGPTRRKHGKKMVVPILAAALALCMFTAGAGIYLNWSAGMEKGMQVTTEQKRKAEDSGLVDFPGLSVTDGGVTVTAQQSIVDNYYAYLSFKVEGDLITDGVQPGFEYCDITVDGQDVSSISSFYDGLIIGEDGRALRDDGSPLPLDDDGSLSVDYLQEDGSFEYQVVMLSDGEKGFFLNKPVHVELTNFGSYQEGKAEEIQVEAEGEWVFDWTLQGNADIYTAECSVPLGETGATVTGIELSPISLKVIYEFPRQEITETGYHESQEMIDGVLTQKSEPFEYTYYADPPEPMRAMLKDGTVITGLNIGRGGRMGYADEESDRYEYLIALDRILDVDEVESLLFKKEGVRISTDLPEDGPQEQTELTEDDFYVVNIR